MISCVTWRFLGDLARPGTEETLRCNIYIIHNQMVQFIHCLDCQLPDFTQLFSSLNILFYYFERAGVQTTIYHHASCFFSDTLLEKRYHLMTRDGSHHHALSIFRKEFWDNILSDDTNHVQHQIELAFKHECARVAWSISSLCLYLS